MHDNSKNSATPKGEKLTADERASFLIQKLFLKCSERCHVPGTDEKALVAEQIRSAEDAARAEEMEKVSTIAEAILPWSKILALEGLLSEHRVPAPKGHTRSPWNIDDEFYKKMTEVTQGKLVRMFNEAVGSPEKDSLFKVAEYWKQQSDALADALSSLLHHTTMADRALSAYRRKQGEPS